MHWETKMFMWLALLWYSLYCSGLEPNPQHLQGLSVFYILQKNTQTSEEVSNIKARAQKKQIKTYWDHLPQIGTWTQPNSCMGFESMWLGLSPAKTHGAWIQNLMKFRFLISHRRKNLSRDKVIAKKWFIQIQRETYFTDKVWAITEGECSHEVCHS